MYDFDCCNLEIWFGMHYAVVVMNPSNPTISLLFSEFMDNQANATRDDLIIT